MIKIPKLADDVVNYLFNLDEGRHLERYCSTCNKITDQVAVSYSVLPPLRQHELEKVLGRVLDIVPGIRLVVGKPTACKCGVVNR
jgi:hypothetical protein